MEEEKMQELIHRFAEQKAKRDHAQRQLEIEENKFIKIRNELCPLIKKYYDGKIDTDYGVFRVQPLNNPSWWKYAPEDESKIKQLSKEIDMIKKRAQKQGTAELAKTGDYIRIY